MGIELCDPVNFNVCGIRAPSSLFRLIKRDMPALFSFMRLSWGGADRGENVPQQARTEAGSPVLGQKHLTQTKKEGGGWKNIFLVCKCESCESLLPQILLDGVESKGMWV